MISVALKKGVEESRTIERVARVIDLLGYREITLKSDAEPAIIAFRNRVAAMCKAEVTTEDAVKGDIESNGVIENAVTLLRGIIRTIKCHTESRTRTTQRRLACHTMFGGAHRMHPVKVVTEGRHRRDCTARSRH